MGIRHGITVKLWMAGDTLTSAWFFKWPSQFLKKEMASGGGLAWRYKLRTIGLYSQLHEWNQTTNLSGDTHSASRWPRSRKSRASRLDS